MRRSATIVSALLLGLALTTPAIAQRGGEPPDGEPATGLRGSGTLNSIPKFVEDQLLGDSIILENVGGIAVAGNVTATGFFGNGSGLVFPNLNVAGTVTAGNFLGDGSTLTFPFLNVAGTVTAAAFSGDGSGLTNLATPTPEHIITDPFNTAIGQSALGSNTTGSFNTVTGDRALFRNTTGSNNTAIGSQALRFNTTGSNNTAVGSRAMVANTTGINNTAVGLTALIANTTGSSNTAMGTGALSSNTTGANNTAFGTSALLRNTTGSGNVAIGKSLTSNTGGGGNTAMGIDALRENTIGGSNTAVGRDALQSNTTGFFNTATGKEALRNDTFGGNNVAIGYRAGFNQTTGSDNIYVGNEGVAGENNVIKVGTSGTHTLTYISGIRGVTTGIADAVMVAIDSAGQLGTISSSRRFKQDIRDMGDESEKLMQLRPVMFRYRKEHAAGERPVEPGLIAEEVAEVYPDLVTYSTEGEIQSVQYFKLSTMLLNELQKQQKLIASLTTRLEALEAKQSQAFDVLGDIPKKDGMFVADIDHGCTHSQAQCSR